jgi:hypothetical protein
MALHKVTVTVASTVMMTVFSNQAAIGACCNTVR